MENVAEPKRVCTARDCQREPDPHWAMCRKHADEVIRSAISWASEPGNVVDWTAAYDERDGGHNER